MKNIVQAEDCNEYPQVIQHQNNSDNELSEEIPDHRTGQVNYSKVVGQRAGTYYVTEDGYAFVSNTKTSKKLFVV